MNMVPPFSKVCGTSLRVENSAAFQDVEGFVHPEMSVDRNARAERHLLGPQSETVGACCLANLDVDVAMVAKMYEMFPLSGPEHISRSRGC